MKAEDLRRLIAEEVAASKAQEQKEVPAPQPVEEEKPEAPITARELRAIIKEELDHKEHPEEDQPLTENSAREILKAELDAYFAPKPEPEAEPVEEEAEEEEEEVVAQPEPSLSLEDIRQVVREELGNRPAEEAPVEEQKVEEAGLSAEELRKIVQEEVAKANELPEQNRKDIAEVKESLLSAEDIRRIIAEELAKIEPVAPVVVAGEPAPVAEPAPADKIIRVRFVDRMAEADPSVIENYNEIKSYALAYGIKSRLSAFCDTFRLHNKTYLRITTIGKNLKLYFALNPADYTDTTLPFKDVSKKKLYADTPLCFKVQSKLSLKRAKALIDDVCGPDGLAKPEGDIEVKNYASQLRFAKIVKEDGEEPEEEDEEE